MMPPAFPPCFAPVIHTAEQFSAQVPAFADELAKLKRSLGALHSIQQQSGAQNAHTVEQLKAAVGNQLAIMDQRMNEKIEEAKQQVKTEIRGEMAGLRTEFNEGLVYLRRDFRDEITRVQGQMSGLEVKCKDLERLVHDTDRVRGKEIEQLRKEMKALTPMKYSNDDSPKRGA